ncbi:MAG: PQQ-dependent sugar dehydrogenase [Vicinamibacterales bacterium]
MASQTTVYFESPDHGRLGPDESALIRTYLLEWWADTPDSGPLGFIEVPADTVTRSTDSLYQMPLPVDRLPRTQALKFTLTARGPYGSSRRSGFSNTVGAVPGPSRAISAGVGTPPVDALRAEAAAPPPAAGTPIRPPWRSGVVRSSDGEAYIVEVVAAGLHEPVGLEPLPGGGWLVAERSGGLREVATNGGLTDIVAGVDDTWFHGLALDPSFAQNGLLYLVESTTGVASMRTGRLVRYRAIGGRLGERAVLVEGLVFAGARDGRLRVGPDGALYVGIAALDAHSASDLASFDGKILRVDRDGRVVGQRFGPVLAWGLRSARAFDWLLDGRLASVEGDTAGAAAAGSSEPLVVLHAASDPIGVVVYRGARWPALLGDLLVTSSGRQSITRLRTASGGAGAIAMAVGDLPVMDRGTVGEIRLGADGAVYVTASEAGERADVHWILRLVPSSDAPVR